MVSRSLKRIAAHPSAQDHAESSTTDHLSLRDTETGVAQPACASGFAGRGSSGVRLGEDRVGNNRKISVVAHCALTAALRLHVQVILGRQDGNRPDSKKSAYADMWRSLCNSDAAANI